MITIKPTRWKHPSGYRRIFIKSENIEADSPDVIHFFLPDHTSIRIDSKNGELRFFSNDYDFKLDKFICSDAFVYCERKTK